MADQPEDRFAFRDYARTTASCLELRPGMCYETWAVVGTVLGRVSNGAAWWLGDWLVYGERTYGRRYTEALEVTQLDYQTLRGRLISLLPESQRANVDKLSLEIVEIFSAYLRSLPPYAQIAKRPLTASLECSNAASRG